MSKHQAKVVKISEILKHPNADSLGLVEVDGFQVVVRLDQFKSGDLAVYIEPDSVVPAIPQFKFVWEKDGGGQVREIAPDQEIPEKWRRVTVRKFRKEWSEGLLLPVSDFVNLYIPSAPGVTDGDDVTELLGITHWNPPEDPEDRGPSVKQSRTRPKS